MKKNNRTRVLCAKDVGKSRGKPHKGPDRVTPILDLLDMSGLLIPTGGVTNAVAGSECGKVQRPSTAGGSACVGRAAFSKVWECSNCGSPRKNCTELFADGQEACKCGAVVALAAAYSLSHEKQMSCTEDKTARADNHIPRHDLDFEPGRSVKFATNTIVPGAKAGGAIHRAQSMLDKIAVAEGHLQGGRVQMGVKELGRERRIFAKLEEIFDELCPLSENVKSFVRSEVRGIWKMSVEHSRCCLDQKSCGLRVVDRSAMAVARSAVRWIASSTNGVSTSKQECAFDRQHVAAVLTEKMQTNGALALGSSSSHLTTSCAMFEVMHAPGFSPDVPCTRRATPDYTQMQQRDDGWWTGLLMDLERICFYHDRQLPMSAEASARKLLQSRPMCLFVKSEKHDGAASQYRVHIAFHLVHLLVVEASLRSDPLFRRKKQEVACLINIGPTNVECHPSCVQQAVDEFLKSDASNDSDDPYA